MSNNWISTKDRLPDVNKTDGDHEQVTVITYRRNQVSPMIYERATVRGKTVYRWKWMWDRICDDGDNITHWQPLPDGPED